MLQDIVDCLDLVRDEVNRCIRGRDLHAVSESHHVV